MPASGLWASATDTKALFDPVMALMGHKSEEGTDESSEKPESSQHPPAVENLSEKPRSSQHKSKEEEKEGTELKTDGSLYSAAEQATAEEENGVHKVDKDAEHRETAEETNAGISDPELGEFGSIGVPVIQPEPNSQDVETLESVGSVQEKENSEVGPSENSALMQVKSGAMEEDQVESSTILPHKSYNGVDKGENMDKQETQVDSMDKKRSQAKETAETISPVEAEASSDSHAGGVTEPSGLHSVSTEETDGPDESSINPLTGALPSDDALAMVSELVSHENDIIVKSVEMDKQAPDNESEIKAQWLSSGSHVSDSTDTMLELEKVTREMKMMETALQGAARQAQVFHKA